MPQGMYATPGMYTLPERVVSVERPDTSPGAYRALDTPVPPPAPALPTPFHSTPPVPAPMRPGGNPYQDTGAEVYPSVAEMPAMTTLTDYTAPPENKSGDTIVAAPRAPVMGGVGGGVTTPGVPGMMGNIPGMMPMPAAGTVASDAMMNAPQPTIQIPGVTSSPAEMPMMGGGMAPIPSMAMDTPMPPASPMPSVGGLPPMNVPPSMDYIRPRAMTPGMRQPQGLMLPMGL